VQKILDDHKIEKPMVKYEAPNLAKILQVEKKELYQAPTLQNLP